MNSVFLDFVLFQVVSVDDWPDNVDEPPQYGVFSMIEQAVDWVRSNEIGPTIVIDK